MKTLTPKDLNNIKQLQQDYTELTTALDNLDKTIDLFRYNCIASLELTEKELEGETRIEILLNLIHERIYQESAKVQKEAINLTK